MDNHETAAAAAIVTSAFTSKEQEPLGKIIHAVKEAQAVSLDNPGASAVTITVTSTAASTEHESLSKTLPAVKEDQTGSMDHRETSSATATLTSDATGTDQVPSSRKSEVAMESQNPLEGGVKRKREDGEVGGTTSADDKRTSLHPLYKTSLCSFLRGHSGVCRHGDSCRFAHSEEELRAKPDGSWDPTSKRAKKMLKAENEERNARVGEPGNGTMMMTDVISEDPRNPRLSQCLIHLPLKWSSDKLTSFLDEQGVAFKSVKKKIGMSVGFASFETLEQVNAAIELLDGKIVGGKAIKVADVIPRSYDDKIAAAQKEQTGLKCRPGEEAECPNLLDEVEGGHKYDASGAKVKSVRDAVTPLAHMPYSEQLELKKKTLRKTLKKLTISVRKACPNGVPLPEWVDNSRIIGNQPCVLEGIIESPLIDGYRNKCEFTAGFSVQGKPTVGFLLGNFREGVTAVEEPVDCPNISKIACKYALIFQEFLQGSALPIWNRFKNTGFWRQFTVREGRGLKKGAIKIVEPDVSEVLLMVQICSLNANVDLMNDELKKMSQAFLNGAALASPPLPLTVLVVQDHTGISNVAPADAPLQTLFCSGDEIDPSSEVADAVAEAQIHESVCNLRFRISPTAFFQVNTLCAEKLYSLAGDWAGLGSNTLLFDVCCGTGTIGLTLAHRVGLVVGIEMNASAVSDAHRNAEINGIKNCRFVCSKAEDVMGSLLKEYLDLPERQIKNEGDGKTHSEGVNEKTHFEDVVAIVDPPRMGLHPVVIKALRTHPCIRRLVYISCNAETLVANAIELCTPSSNRSEQQNTRGFRHRGLSSAGLARHRTKSMPSSEPFRPVKAMAVDVFPHTPHCEVVMLLER